MINNEIQASANKAKKGKGIFTFVKSEKIFLPIRLGYYSKYFSGEDIYVIDHQSNDGSVQECLERYKFHIIQVENKYYDNIWKINLAKKFQAELLEEYEYVVYADTDEIIIPAPQKYESLGDYINQLTSDYAVCDGYHLFTRSRAGEPVITR